MKTWNKSKTKKYTDDLLPKMKEKATVLCFKVGQLGESNTSLTSFLTSLGLRKKFLVQQ
jgi:hypothetical protein